MPIDESDFGSLPSIIQNEVRKSLGADYQFRTNNNPSDINNNELTDHLVDLRMADASMDDPSYEAQFRSQQVSKFKQNQSRSPRKQPK